MDVHAGVPRRGAAAGVSGFDPGLVRDTSGIATDPRRANLSCAVRG
jgi:hypothetical protein